MNRNERENHTSQNFKISTEEAITLINMLKERVSETLLEFPIAGERLEFDAIAKVDGTKFIVNINRGAIDKRKCTYQGRTYINSIPLLRLDVTTSCHINSDGTKIVGPHLHIYNEYTEMREAIPFNVKSEDLYECCLEFFRKFNIIQDNYRIKL